MWVLPACFFLPQNWFTAIQFWLTPCLQLLYAFLWQLSHWFCETDVYVNVFEYGNLARNNRWFLWVIQLFVSVSYIIDCCNMQDDYLWDSQRMVWACLMTCMTTQNCGVAKFRWGSGCLDSVTWFKFNDIAMRGGRYSNQQSKNRDRAKKP